MTKKYKLLNSCFYTTKDKQKRCFNKGDLVELSDKQYQAFKDMFEPADLKQKQAKAEIKANEEAETKAKQLQEARAKAQARANDQTKGS